MIEIAQRMVVLPALSNPRTRIRASLFPNREENILVNKMPIFVRDLISPQRMNGPRDQTDLSAFRGLRSDLERRTLNLPANTTTE
ncbi:hypothetical protein ACFX15_022255 [Malus domestica]